MRQRDKGLPPSLIEAWVHSAVLIDSSPMVTSDGDNSAFASCICAAAISAFLITGPSGVWTLSQVWVGHTCGVLDWGHHIKGKRVRWEGAEGGGGPRRGVCHVSAGPGGSWASEYSSPPLLKQIPASYTTWLIDGRVSCPGTVSVMQKNYRANLCTLLNRVFYTSLLPHKASAPIRQLLEPVFCCCLAQLAII